MRRRREMPFGTSLLQGARFALWALDAEKVELSEGPAGTGLVDVSTEGSIPTEERGGTAVLPADKLLHGFPVALLVSS